MQNSHVSYARDKSYKELAGKLHTNTLLDFSNPPLSRGPDCCQLGSYIGTKQPVYSGILAQSSAAFHDNYVPVRSPPSALYSHISTLKDRLHQPARSSESSLKCALNLSQGNLLRVCQRHASGFRLVALYQSHKDSPVLSLLQYMAQALAFWSLF